MGSLVLTLKGIAQSPPIGSWRMHLSYQSAIGVAKGDKIYTATKQGIFTTDNTQNFEYFNKLTGLSNAALTKICWDSSSSQLIIVYNNSNIDVIKGGLVKNINDIFRSNINGNKKINAVYAQSGLAYFSTSIGVVVADLTKYEIKETWILGAAGSEVEILSLSKDKEFWFASTRNAIYKTPVSNTNLGDAKTWSLLYNVSAGSAIQKINSTPTGLIIQQNDSLLLINTGMPSLLFNKALQKISCWTYNEDKIIVGTTEPQSGRAFIHLLTPGTNNNIVFEQASAIKNPTSCILSNGIIWISDSLSGLVQLNPKNNTFLKIIPNGPGGQINTGMLATGTNLMAGGLSQEGLFVLDNNGWQTQKQSGLDSLSAITSITQNPLDNSIWLASFGNGAGQLKDGKLQIFTAKNSSLVNVANNCFTSGVAADTKGNSWVSNSGTATSLHVKQPDGKWTGFTNPFGLTDAGAIEIDDAGQIWCVTKNANGLLVYNPGNSITSLADDRWKQYKAGTGIGNLPSNQVNCTAKDKSGFIWVGTDRGIGIIECADQAFTSAGCDALLPIVQQDRFAGLLFKDENVVSIAVDGADRKWIGTKNGVWLISATGDKILYKFSTTNSPLLGNEIYKISIDPITGEVFIATDNGLCSFRSTATEGVSLQQKVWVFPNPVPPGYPGTIAIRGLTNSALVKITNLQGTLVYQTRALGGQAVWDCKNTSGAKVASGIYLIICRDDSGTEKIVSKIAIVQGR